MNELFNMLLNSGAIQGTANQVGLDQDAIKGLVQTLIPQMLGQIDQNTQDDTQAEALNNALEKHNGNDLAQLLADIANIDVADGNKINNRIFGGNVDSVASQIGSQFGLNASQTQSVMDILAPIVMQFLGKTANETNNRGNNLIDLTSQIATLFNSDEEGATQGGSLVETILNMFK